MNLLRVIECHVIQRKVICNRRFLLNHIICTYCRQIILGRWDIRTQITILSDLTLIIENAIIKHLHVISSVLMRFNLRISTSFHQHHSLEDPHLLLSVVLIAHAFTLMIELLIHGVVAVARTDNALIVGFARYFFLFLLVTFLDPSSSWLVRQVILNQVHRFLLWDKVFLEQKFLLKCFIFTIHFVHSLRSILILLCLSIKPLLSSNPICICDNPWSVVVQQLCSLILIRLLLNLQLCITYHVW
jgi:hypothetical protein